MGTNNSKNKPQVHHLLHKDDVCDVMEHPLRVKLQEKYDSNLTYAPPEEQICLMEGHHPDFCFEEGVKTKPEYARLYERALYNWGRRSENMRQFEFNQRLVNRITFGNQVEHNLLKAVTSDKEDTLNPLIRFGEQTTPVQFEIGNLFLGYNFATNKFEGYEPVTQMTMNIHTSIGTFFGVENDIRQWQAFLATMEWTLRYGKLSDAALKVFEQKYGTTFGNAVAHYLNKHSSPSVSVLCHDAAMCHNSNPLLRIYLYETFGEVGNHSAWSIFRETVKKGFMVQPEIYSYSSPESKSLYLMPYFLLDILSFSLAESLLALSRAILSKAWRRQKDTDDVRLNKFRSWKQAAKDAFYATTGNQFAATIMIKVLSFIFLSGISTYLSSPPLPPTGAAIQPFDLEEMGSVEWLVDTVKHTPKLLYNFVTGASYQLGSLSASLLIGVPFYAILGFAPNLNPVLSFTVTQVGLVFAAAYIRCTSLSAAQLTIGSTWNFLQYVVGYRKKDDKILSIPSVKWIWRLLNRTLVASMADFVFMAVTTEVLKDIIVFHSFGIGIYTETGWAIWFFLLLGKTFMRIVETLIYDYFFRVQDQLAEEDIKEVVKQKKRERVHKFTAIAGPSNMDTILISKNKFEFFSLGEKDDSVIVECNLADDQSGRICHEIRMRLERRLTGKDLENTNNAGDVADLLTRITGKDFKFTAYRDEKDPQDVFWTFASLRANPRKSLARLMDEDDETETNSEPKERASTSGLLSILGSPLVNTIASVVLRR